MYCTVLYSNVTVHKFSNGYLHKEGWAYVFNDDDDRTAFVPYLPGRTYLNCMHIRQVKGNPL